MARITKLTLGLSHDELAIPEELLATYCVVAERLRTDLGVTATDPAVVSLRGLDHPRFLFVRSTAPVAMTVEYSDNSTIAVSGDILMLGFAADATVVPVGLRAEITGETGATLNVTLLGV